jgi:predicted aspartyl protease
MLRPRPSWLLPFLVAVSCAAPSFESRHGEAERLLQQGDPRAAAEQLELALAGTAAEPADARSLVAALTDLGEIYFTYPELGEGERAETVLLRARELADTHLAADDPLRLTALDRLGRYYAMEGRWSEAVNPLEAWIEAAERYYGPDRAYRSEAARSLKLAYAQTGAEAEADALAVRIEFPDRPPPGSQDRGVAEIDAAALYLEPNVVDVDGTPAFVHFGERDMPLTVAIPLPDSSAIGSWPEDTRRAAVSGFNAWAYAIRRILPWFELDVHEEHPDPDIAVRWSRRPRGYLPARGAIGYRIEEGSLRVTGEIVLSTQPIPSQRARVSPGELRVHAMHAFGSALGLPDCRRCDSMMSLAWRRRDSFVVSDLDLRTFEALVQTPNGLRVDGGQLAGMQELDAVPGVQAAAGVLAARGEPGVLADLPFLNTGRGGSVYVDLAPANEASLVLTLDTGAMITILTDDYARAMGISVRSAKSDPYRRSTVTGTPLVFWVMGQRVVGGGRGPTHFNYALLGSEFLEHYVVELDFERRRVRFLDPEVHEVGDTTGEIVVELSMRERRPYAQLELGGGSVWALVDTGAESPISTTEEQARKLGIEIDRSAERRNYVNVLGTSVNVMQRLPEARLGTVTLVNPEIHIALSDESQVRVSRWLQDETIIGIEILENYRVRFDYPRAKLGLTPAGSDER